MPVAFIPGWPIVVWLHLCLWCRLAVRMSRHFHRHGVPGEVWKFSANPNMRAAYDEWEAVQEL